MIGMGGPGVHPSYGLIHVTFAGAHAGDHAFQPAFEGAHIGFRQCALTACVEDVAEKLGRFGGGNDHGFTRMELQPAAFLEAHDLVAPRRQDRRIIMKQSEVINIAQIGCAQDFRAEMVKRIEIDVGAELAGEVADRQPATPGERAQQIIAAKVQVHRLLRVGAIDDHIHQRERGRAGHPTSEVALEDGVIDRGKEPKDVAAQNVGMPVAIPFVSLNRPMRALADPVCERFADKSVLKQRRYHGH